VTVVEIVVSAASGDASAAKQVDASSKWRIKFPIFPTMRPFPPESGIGFQSVRRSTLLAGFRGGSTGEWSEVSVAWLVG
jgi:hypothetical protein